MFAQLSLFENDAPEFIIPIELYEQRVRNLEAATSRTNCDSISVEVFFSEDGNGLEDTVHTSYPGSYVKHDEDKSTVGLSFSPHLRGSGYRSVHLKWEGDRRVDVASPWEVSITSPEEFSCQVQRPHLNEEEKRSVRDALREIRAMPGVQEYFGQPVSEAYSDYSCRVEVPMNLSFISNRLEAGYYSNIFSVMADVRLILTNCVKYNGENDDLSGVAQEMVGSFGSKVLSAANVELFHRFDIPLTDEQPRVPVSFLHNTSEDIVPVEASTTERRRLRTAEAVSVLETFAEGESLRRSSRVPRPPRTFREEDQSLRRSSRTRSVPHRGNSRRTQGRGLAEAPIRTLEQLSSSHLRVRGRSPGYGRRGRTVVGNQTRLRLRISTRERGATHSRQPVSRQSTRPGLRNSAPQELQVDSNTDGLTRPDQESLAGSPPELPALRSSRRRMPLNELHSDRVADLSAPRNQADNESSARAEAVRRSSRRHSQPNDEDQNEDLPSEPIPREPRLVNEEDDTVSLPIQSIRLSTRTSARDGIRRRNTRSNDIVDTDASSSESESDQDRMPTRRKTSRPESNGTRKLNATKKRNRSTRHKRPSPSLDVESSVDESSSEAEEEFDLEQASSSANHSDSDSSSIPHRLQRKRARSNIMKEESEAPRRPKRQARSKPRNDLHKLNGIDVPKPVKRKRNTNGSDTADSPRRQRAVKSYVDPSSSEFDDDDSSIREFTPSKNRATRKTKGENDSFP